MVFAGAGIRTISRGFSAGLESIEDGFKSFFPFGFASAGLCNTFTPSDSISRGAITCYRLTIVARYSFIARALIMSAS